MPWCSFFFNVALWNPELISCFGERFGSIPFHLDRSSAVAATFWGEIYDMLAASNPLCVSFFRKQNPPPCQIAVVKVWAKVMDVSREAKTHFKGWSKHPNHPKLSYAVWRTPEEFPNFELRDQDFWVKVLQNRTANSFANIRVPPSSVVVLGERDWAKEPWWHRSFCFHCCSPSARWSQSCAWKDARMAG